jgi:peptidyl-prolyl cis-trans isomerase B (cyclophilin B)
MKAIIKTSKGNMVADLYDTDAPNTVANFKKLAEEGYYNNLTWHRVLPAAFGRFAAALGPF